MTLLEISTSYLRQRALGTLLNVLILALGIATIVVLLVLGTQIEQNLSRNARGIDLVVGAKGSPLQLILSAVYHIDAPTGNISLDDAAVIEANPMVESAIPLALGDAYRGFRIVGTTDEYPAHYEASLAAGQLWSEPNQATLGATVARESGLGIGDTFHSAHGLGAGGQEHGESPLTVVGVLTETGTVLDRLVLTSVETVWEVHGIHGHDHEDGGRGDDHAGDHDEHGDDHDDEHDDDHDEQHADDHDSDHLEDGGTSAPMRAGGQGSTPEPEYTALLVRYASPLAAISFPRFVNTQTNLQAASPPFETARLFNILGVGFDAIRAFGIVLIIVAILSLFVALLNSFKERRYDLAVMRVLGASGKKLTTLILLESLILGGSGALLGLVFGHAAAAAFGAALQQSNGMDLGNLMLVEGELLVVAIALAAGLLAGLIPAIQAYRTDIALLLADG